MIITLYNIIGAMTDGCRSYLCFVGGLLLPAFFSGWNGKIENLRKFNIEKCGFRAVDGAFLLFMTWLSLKRE